MCAVLRRRIGFELELLAPRGSSRRTLADELAARCGGAVRPVWHVDSEPVPIQSLGGRFIHLTQGFEVRGRSGELLCTLVDDITIGADLDQAAPALPGWQRLLTDDLRFAWLLDAQCDPATPLEKVLDPVADRLERKRYALDLAIQPQHMHPVRGANRRRTDLVGLHRDQEGLELGRRLTKHDVAEPPAFRGGRAVGKAARQTLEPVWMFREFSQHGLCLDDRPAVG